MFGGSGGGLPIVGGGGIHKDGEVDDAVVDAVKYINPIILVGSTCIQLGNFCGKYSVFNNQFSTS